MKVVLDTNVLVAAVAARGACAELLARVLAAHELGVDESLLHELDRVLRTKIRAPPQAISDLSTLLRARGTVVDPPPLRGPACRDPDDDRILALCIAFRCDLLVTGDDDLLVLDPFQDIRIVRPRDFWALDRGPGPRDP